MSPALYLIDTSGLFRIFQEQHRQVWSDELASGVIATCPTVDLEFLYSARSRADRTEKLRMLEAVFGWVRVGDGACERADEVQRALTERGQHPSAGAVDLLIAATAERERLVLLCDGRGFETISSVTGRPVRRVLDSPRAGAAAPRWQIRKADDEGD